mmetsp:Transcript_26676/g.53238  ORF Transcript_26676/g.53238 Transcript_26676/m.53238 type:complete len:206 (+) Transcript_26676:1130-1747(+)
MVRGNVISVVISHNSHVIVVLIHIHLLRKRRLNINITITDIDIISIPILVHIFFLFLKLLHPSDPRPTGIHRLRSLMGHRPRSGVVHPPRRRVGMGFAKDGSTRSSSVNIRSGDWKTHFVRSFVSRAIAISPPELGAASFAAGLAILLQTCIVLFPLIPIGKNPKGCRNGIHFLFDLSSFLRRLLVESRAIAGVAGAIGTAVVLR